MKFSACVFFAKRLVLPRTAKKSTAHRSVLGSVLCIAISVVPLVTVISVSDGMFHGMTERIVGLSSGHIQAVINRKSDIVKDYPSFKEFAESFEEQKGVLNAFPEIDSDALASSRTYRTGAKIRAVEPSVFFENKSFSELLKVTDGKLDDFQNGKKTCVVGEKIASDLGLKSGDTIRLITSRRVSSYKIAALVSSGYQELDALWVFIPIEGSYGFLSRENSFHSVMVSAENSSMKDIVRLQSELNDFYRGKIRAYRWDEVNSATFENFSSTRILLVFVMFLIVLVASVNISSALVMLVMERRREIAILKSVGASASGISFSFLLAGGFCGLSGALIGLPAGILVSVFVNSIVKGTEKILNFLLGVFNGGSISLMDPAYYLQEIPVDIPFSKVFLIALSVVFLSLIVSIIPSVKAGKEKPLEIFRKV